MYHPLSIIDSVPDPVLTSTRSILTLERGVERSADAIWVLTEGSPQELDHGADRLDRKALGQCASRGSGDVEPVRLAHLVPS